MVPSDYPSIRIMTALTAMDGSFRFDNIFPGSYELFASGPVTPPSYFAHIHLSLNSNNVLDLNLQLKPGRSTQIDLRSGETASSLSCSAEGTITLQSLGLWPLVRDQKLTASISPGTPAHFDNLGPGLFVITAQSSSGKCAGVTDRILDMTTEDAAPHVVRGFAPDASIHGSIAAMELAILRDVTPGRDAPIQAFFANSAAEFRFDGLAAGRYCVFRQPATDPVPRWLPESGCVNPPIDLSPGDSKELK